LRNIFESSVKSPGRMSDPLIRPMSLDDLEGALRLNTIVGWNQQLDDWRVLLQLAPRGAFAALKESQIVGTCIGIDYGGFGWIAMMLVDPAMRGQGLGRRLLETAMDVVPANLPIRLDATPLGRPLYHKYGFEDEAVLHRHVADFSGRLKPPTTDKPPSAGPPPLTTAELATVIERDREVFGGTRDIVLEWAFQSAAQYARVINSPDGPLDYCFGRHGRLFDQIGPVVARNAERARSLLSAALEGAVDRQVAVDAFEPSDAFAAALHDLGFSVQRPLFRLCRPAAAGGAMWKRRPGSFSEFAIFGPEFA
jgi:GNAT superfamily N-acetyltransferase